VSRIIRACPDCPGVRYEGEECPCCRAIAQAHLDGQAAMRERCADWLREMANAFEQVAEGEDRLAWAMVAASMAGPVRHLARGMRALEVTP